jgi:hypothetical protein
MRVGVSNISDLDLKLADLGSETVLLNGYRFNIGAHVFFQRFHLTASFFPVCVDFQRFLNTPLPASHDNLNS